MPPSQPLLPVYADDKSRRSPTPRTWLQHLTPSQQTAVYAADIEIYEIELSARSAPRDNETEMQKVYMGFAQSVFSSVCAVGVVIWINLYGGLDKDLIIAVNAVIVIVLVVRMVINGLR
jgi:hypothetical protein